MGEAIVDIGCGMNKEPGSFGIDIHKYDGVDLVVDLNKTPWPIPDNSYDRLVSRHVIEHIDNIVGYMKELHRIAKPGAELYIETPHFSSINSWNDPTHKTHLSSRWHENFQPGKWLAAQSGAFELISSDVTFGKSLRNKIGKLIVRLRGIEKWEKSSAFTFPGMDIITRLRISK